MDGPTATITAAAISALGGSLIPSARDWIMVRLGKVPVSDAEYKRNMTARVRALETQLKYVSDELGTVRKHADDCEQDRAYVRAENVQLRLENDYLRKKGATAN